MSYADGLLCAGGDVPIDKRSSRTSVPAFGRSLVPKKSDNKIKLFNQQDASDQALKLIYF